VEAARVFQQLRHGNLVGKRDSFERARRYELNGAIG
jgi:hypothetical protein